VIALSLVAKENTKIFALIEGLLTEYQEDLAKYIAILTIHDSITS
jgi:hypothetical protein